MNRRSFLGIGAVTCAGALTGCTSRTLRSGNEATALVGWTFPAADVDRLAVRSGVGSVLVVAEESATELKVSSRGSHASASAPPTVAGGSRTFSSTRTSPTVGCW